MEGANESTELRRHPSVKFLCNVPGAGQVVIVHLSYFNDPSLKPAEDFSSLDG